MSNTISGTISGTIAGSIADSSHSQERPDIPTLGGTKAGRSTPYDQL
ncbi:MAG: hypothetical protein HC895_24630 [Leptolyngbyaceae cyanobacterium SM1_3_5]|nr:hypothetical protein [Leptolyngbyaceae cyanobacterium SM1_3_5]